MSNTSHIFGQLERNPLFGYMTSLFTASMGAMSLFEVIQSVLGLLGLMVGLTLSTVLLLQHMGILRTRKQIIYLRDQDDDDDD
jgi:hypothetical protein